ncbi:hypothetical protein ABG768_001481 [Culter alburnus]|uniref:Uncharacterized protein n=1 Tax=Culter alburnus TaxID=194366 RepID=A0AAW2A360_CULAL
MWKSSLYALLALRSLPDPGLLLICLGGFWSHLFGSGGHQLRPGYLLSCLLRPPWRPSVQCAPPTLETFCPSCSALDTSCPLYSALETFCPVCSAHPEDLLSIVVCPGDLLSSRLPLGNPWLYDLLTSGLLVSGSWPFFSSYICFCSMVLAHLPATGSTSALLPTNSFVLEHLEAGP